MLIIRNLNLISVQSWTYLKLALVKLYNVRSIIDHDHHYFNAQDLNIAANTSLGFLIEQQKI